MDIEELKARCKKVWEDTYKDFKKFKERYGMTDSDTQEIFSELITIEDTITEITGGLVSYADFEKWRDQK